MNLYKISQDINDDYDTYDSAIVASTTAEQARRIRPDGHLWGDGRDDMWVSDLEQVKVELIGVAADGILDGEVLCASFNAG